MHQAIGDVPCEQIDALFTTTTLNSHDNRCIGAFSGEPNGFAFNTIVTVSLPTDLLLPGETPLWLASTPGDGDYHLIPTVLTYQGEQARVEASLDRLSIIAAAGATARSVAEETNGKTMHNAQGNNGSAIAETVPELPSCCSLTPTPLNCCCTTIKVTSNSGDSVGSGCDCQLVGFELETEFPNCPGSPVFHDSERHSTENCPTDLRAEMTPIPRLWSCQDFDVQTNITGTNENGSKCSMPLTSDWRTRNYRIATIKEIAPNKARITGVGGGETIIMASSVLGDDFFISRHVKVRALESEWQATEEGFQTCTIGDQVVSESESGTGLVNIEVPFSDSRFQACDTISIDIGYPGVSKLTGALANTGNLAEPLTFQLETINSSGTLDCVVFLESDGKDIEFGEPLCPTGATCMALSCSESITTDGTILSSDRPVGEATGESSWTFSASWLQKLEGETQTTTETAVCSGNSDFVFLKQ
jgi:hypothetical protein